MQQYYVALLCLYYVALLCLGTEIFNTVTWVTNEQAEAKADEDAEEEEQLEKTPIGQAEVLASCLFSYHLFSNICCVENYVLQDYFSKYNK